MSSLKREHDLTTIIGRQTNVDTPSTTLARHWVNVSAGLGDHTTPGPKKTQDVHTTLDKCVISASDAGPEFTQRCISTSVARDTCFSRKSVSSRGY